MNPFASHIKKRGFTLIELLVVIAIIAILAVVVVMTLNPAELLRQGRDSNRVSDMDTLTHTLTLYQSDQGGQTGYVMGNASSVYISIPDATLSGTATSTCTSLNLPALPSGYNYQCASPQSYKNVNGTGWIPVNFTKMSTGAPLGSLPADPTNASSTGLYYSYYTNGNQYEVTSIFESQKYKAQYGSSPMDPSYPEVDAKGSSLSISPLFNPSGLVGWWPLTEGTGTTAYDQSGNNITASLYGSGTFWVAGKVGPWAAYQSAAPGDSISYSVLSPLRLPSSSITVAVWVNVVNHSNWINYLGSAWCNVAGAWLLDSDSLGNLYFGIIGPGGTCGNQYNATGGSSTLTTGQWHFIVGTYDQAIIRLYLDGMQVGSTSLSNQSLYQTTTLSTSPGSSNFSFDDLRLFNRALSPAEIQALYNAEK